MKPGENFNVHWPIRRGQLNLHPGVGGSLSSVLSDLETIWSTALQKFLDISPKDIAVSFCYFNCNLSCSLPFF